MFLPSSLSLSFSTFYKRGVSTSNAPVKVCTRTLRGFLRITMPLCYIPADFHRQDRGVAL